MANFYGQYVGFGAGGAVPAFIFGGENYGYSYGGTSNSNINQWSFASGVQNGSDVGDQSVERRNTGGASSATHGYNFGGWPSDIIDKFQFTAGGTMSNVGDLSASRRYMSSASTEDYGWSAGGAAPNTDVIERFPFASDTNATDWEDLAFVRSACCTGLCSAIHGYTAGGGAGGYDDWIDKYQFAVAAESTDVGDLTNDVISTIGTSSATHGYAMGGNEAASVTVSDINKISFSSDVNATKSGDITKDAASADFAGQGGRMLGTGASSTTYGYIAGGGFTGPTYDGESNIIDKMSFSSEGDSTDVGNLTQVDHYQGQGSQY